MMPEREQNYTPEQRRFLADLQSGRIAAIDRDQIFKLKQWCVEQAIKAPRADCGTADIAREIYEFITEEKAAT